MPFPAGTVVLCQQGNLSPSWRTHFKENSRHAVDLSNTSLPSLAVVPAAPGRIAYVLAGSAPDDRKAGSGFGNQVKVEHGDGYFTMYAHLDTVSARVGDVADTAYPIGTVGCTGAAGNRHLHFSLHQGDPAIMGVYETIAMDALVTADLEGGTVEGGIVEVDIAFRTMSSTDLRDGRTNLWDGALYASENEPGKPPVSGAPPAELGARIGAAHRQLKRAVGDRMDLDAIALDWERREWERREVGWARALIMPVLGRSPRHCVARYWFAMAVESAEGRPAPSEAILRDLLATGPAEATWETWLYGWIHNRLGAIALEKGQRDEARSHFTEGLRVATAEPERAFAREHLRLLERGGVH